MTSSKGPTSMAAQQPQMNKEHRSNEQLSVGPVERVCGSPKRLQWEAVNLDQRNPPKSPGASHAFAPERLKVVRSVSALFF